MERTESNARSSLLRWATGLLGSRVSGRRRPRRPSRPSRLRSPAATQPLHALHPHRLRLRRRRDHRLRARILRRTRGGRARPRRREARARRRPSRDRRARRPRDRCPGRPRESPQRGSHRRRAGAHSPCVERSAWRRRRAQARVRRARAREEWSTKTLFFGPPFEGPSAPPARVSDRGAWWPNRRKSLRPNVAGAHGNRTHQALMRGFTGFEDRGGHQAPIRSRGGDRGAGS